MNDEQMSEVERQFVLGTPIDDALREAAYETLLRHKRLGQPIVVWRDGRTVRIPAEEIQLSERAEEHVSERDQR